MLRGVNLIVNKLDDKKKKELLSFFKGLKEERERELRITVATGLRAASGQFISAVGVRGCRGCKHRTGCRSTGRLAMAMAIWL